MCAPVVTSKMSSKIQACDTKIASYAAFKPLYLPMHETIFCQEPDVSNSNFQFTCRAKFSAFG